ncbi:MAG: Fe2+-dependent dioxygenase [Magnetospiraceae bacterium]
MVLLLDQVLTTEHLGALERFLQAAVFRDGAATTGAAARGKRNLEMDRENSAGAEQAERLIVAALSDQRALSDYALPRHYSAPIFSRYEPGMGYPQHVDNPLLGASAMRSDISVTLFLSDPAHYTGGELVLDLEGGEQAIKLPAGSAVAYTTGTPHRVAPVTRGARMTAVLWIQSLVADPHRRGILGDFQRLHHHYVTTAPDSPETETFLGAYYRLFRLWAQP